MLPTMLGELTASVSNTQGAWAGPFVPVVPYPVPGWTAYNYATGAQGTFTINATDGTVAVRATRDGTTVGVPYGRSPRAPSEAQPTSIQKTNQRPTAPQSRRAAPSSSKARL
jgi:hypothetical protein